MEPETIHEPIPVNQEFNTEFTVFFTSKAFKVQVGL